MTLILHYNSLYVCKCLSAFAVCCLLIVVKLSNSLRSEIECCNRTSDVTCGQSCISLLVSNKSSHEIVDTLTSFCGLPFNSDASPNNLLWQCLLSHSASTSSAVGKSKSKTRTKTNISREDDKNVNTNKNSENSNNNTKNKKTANGRRQSSLNSFSDSYSFGMDSAKLKCCGRAKSDTCKTLCEKTFSTEWTENWDQFERICQYSAQETNLIECLEDAEGICELGCSGLQFCHIFNDRHNQLFRKCNAKADAAAKVDFELWTKGIVNINMMQIAVKNVANCNPHVWKAIACSYHIKPCRSDNHQNNICRSSCVHIISECIDSKRIPSTVLSASTICDLISTNDTQKCIDINTFLDDNNKLTSITDPLLNVCNPNPCATKRPQICVVNNNCNSDNCVPFRCLPACKLGQISSFVVSYNSKVRIPFGDNCQLNCECDPNGRLLDCSEECSENVCGDCVINANNVIRHSTRILIDDRDCVCHNGLLHCINSKCVSLCPQLFSPVCASNGQTYPNECFARCNGLSAQLFDGRCDEQSDCEKCNKFQICVKRSAVCLLSSDCPQYECVTTPFECQLVDTNSPVCDTYGATHANLCLLLMKGMKFAYNGKCLLYCSHSGPVCGLNGVTYQSECVSLSHSVPVDYFSSCRHVSSDNCLPNRIKCPNQPKCANNYLHNLAHNCCPICGSIAQFVYAKNANVSHYWRVTVEQLANTFKAIIRLFGCQLFCYLSVDGYVTLIATPKANSETHQMQCRHELRRIVTLVNNQSPIISLQFPLSLLLRGELIGDNDERTNQNSAANSNLCALLVVLIVIRICRTFRFV